MTPPVSDVTLTGNKHRWVPLMIEVKSEGPRERSASRNNTRQNEPPRMPPNNRNELRGEGGGRPEISLLGPPIQTGTQSETSSICTSETPFCVCHIYMRYVSAYIDIHAHTHANTHTLHVHTHGHTRTH